MNLTYIIHKDLPREAPGDSKSTTRAFSLLKNLPPTPNILDIGCGPGAQTIDLAKLSKGKIIALDRYQPYLKELETRAKKSKVSRHITTLEKSMFELTFPKHSFDLIWAEGAIYIRGFEEGLREWKTLLKSQGYIAVSELSWLSGTKPREAKKFWAEYYPQMKSIKQNLNIIRKLGYTLVDHFTLPQTSWWKDYYTPLEARLKMLNKRYKNNPAALARLNKSTREIELYRKYHKYYGYEFYIMQK